VAVNFQALASELVGDIPRLDVLKANLIVNDAWRDIRESRLWSFLTQESVLYAPQVTTAGTVSVTQYSATITFDATAKAAVNALSMTTPPTIQQFRVSMGPVYSIIAYNSGTGVATLDRLYAEGTAAGTGYQMYRCYYDAPVANFRRWISIFDPINGYPFRDMTWSKRDIDIRDPLRGAINQPFYMASYRQDPQTKLPTFEMWPHPQQQVGYLALYDTYGNDLAGISDTVPYQIARGLVMAKARQYAYVWASANAGRWTELQKVNWRTMAQDQQKYYRDELARAQLQDEEIFLTTYTSWANRDWLRGPLTGSFLQSHEAAYVFGEI
jgi:hypothetical protein